MSILDNFDIPFSTYGSYLSFHYYDETYMNAPDIGNFPVPKPYQKGFILRTNRYAVMDSFICCFIPCDENGKCEYKLEKNYVETKLITETGSVSFCFAKDDTFLIKVDQGLSLKIDFTARNKLFQHGYELPDGRFIVECFKNDCRFLIDIQKGAGTLVQDWHTDHTDSLVLHVEGKEGILLSVHETVTDFSLAQVKYDYDEELNKAKQKFNQMVNSYSIDVTNEVDLAAVYLNYSCTVKPEGNLKRYAMLMSKNFMNRVWSWDHAFNAWALSYKDPVKAWDQFMIMFDYQLSNGRIPDDVSDSEINCVYCKPPVHGWILSKMRNHMELSREQLVEAYDKLSKWTKWWLTCRDMNHDGIYEYTHGNDSGWDNASAFDLLPPVDSPDLQALLVLQMRELANLAKELGKLSEETKWKEKATQLKDKTLQELIVGDRPVSRRTFSKEVIEKGCLLPYYILLFGEEIDVNLRESMIQDLEDHFLTEHGLATEMLSSSKYEEDGYFRGPIWAPCTMIMLEALERCHYDKLVKKIAESFLDMVSKNGFAENFNALTGKALRDRAYSWTSSIYLVIKNEYSCKNA